MAKAGKRYPLVIYRRMMDRWWPVLFFLGLALLALALAGPFYADLYLRLTEPWRWMTLAGLGAAVIVVSLIMLILRNSAHVQAFHDHLRLATPFLRMNISYRRIHRTTTAAMHALFPPSSMSGLKREIIEPLGKMTAVVVELTSLPMAPGMLQLFLSPFFFKDKTPHLVILVQNWMGFSTELESMRVGGDQPAPGKGQPSQSILLRLPKK